jgi:hypothetical protein
MSSSRGDNVEVEADGAAAAAAADEGVVDQKKAEKKIDKNDRTGLGDGVGAEEAAGVSVESEASAGSAVEAEERQRQHGTHPHHPTAAKNHQEQQHLTKTTSRRQPL